MQPEIWKVAAVFAVVVIAYGQSSRGTVTGSVLDPSGAVMAGANVALTGIQTGTRRSTTTNEAGIYRFDAVDLDRYDLTVTHPGFRPFRSGGVGVEANRVTTFDPQLEVGSAAAEVWVNGEASEVLIRDSPLRGGNFRPREVRDLPLISSNPLSLARTLPGVTQASGSGLKSSGTANHTLGTEFAINGQRTRGNNYLLDGTENNDVAFTGVAQPFNIADAVEEVSVQTGNFGVEFGRAGGGVFNVVTKSGTNSFHGTLLWRYQSQRFNSISNLDRLNGIGQSVFSNNVYGFTVGGPVRKNKTFFYAGYQQDNTHSTTNFGLKVPTAEAVSRLRSLFPSNPRLELYLGSLNDLRGSGAPFPQVLGLDSQTGIDRGSVQFGTGNYVLPATSDGPQWLVRSDHYQSEAHRLSWRYLFDSRITSPRPPGFPGFILDQAYRNHNFLFADSYTFGPSYTNEFRFSYGRLQASEGSFSDQSVPLARTLPAYGIANIAGPGIGSQQLQFRDATNLLFQETQTKLAGRHAFRYGAELLRQRVTQAPSANTLGRLTYTNAPGYSAFANFLDDFSGPSGSANKVFGAEPFHPNVLRQSYFFQDNWKATPSLTLTLGLRYENSGQPVNVMRFPAFTGFNPTQFLARAEVNRDNNDFGPAVGLAWSPAANSSWLGRLFGDRKTVVRGGYQISYDAFFTQMISLGLATSTPNAADTSSTAPATGRGLPNWSNQLPTVPRAPLLTDSQSGGVDKDIRSPYTERWSFGFQRLIPGNVLLDVSYVGSVSHKLMTRADLNPGPDGLRLHPEYGQRWITTSQGNSAYHSLQWRADRRFAHGFQFSAAYTWSRMIDSTSEGVGSGNTQSGSQYLTSVPISQGGLKLDRGLSDYDRRQRLTLVYLWEIPGTRTGALKNFLGGWTLAGIASFQSGTPFTVSNGTDRNNDGIANADRPDIGNPNAPLNSRAAIAPATGPLRCPSGYRDPDAGACVNAADVHWIEGRGFPNASTVGRNTLTTGGTNNLDASLSKSIPLGEKRRLQFHWEAFNALNHPQFTQVPGKTISSTLPGQFLNRDFTNSGIRSMWGQIKLIF